MSNYLKHIELQKIKIEVIGIFHSHPNSDAFPSKTDKKFMQSNPVVWIIYSESIKISKHIF